jgi:hypothetical protein
MSLRYPVATSGLVEMFFDVVADAVAGAADVLGAGVPLEMIEHGPAAVGGGVVCSVAHPANTKTTPASGAAAFLRDGIRISRR